MIHEICTNTFRAESKCMRRLENTLPLALQGGEGTYIKNNSACAFKANTLFITRLFAPLPPGKNKHHPKQNLTQEKTASWVGMKAILPWSKVTFKISFQAHYSLALSKHCLWREIKYGWVFKWRKQQRLTDSVWLQKGNWICTFISCISHLFHSGMRGM